MGTPDNNRKSAQKKWKMPFAAFTGSSQLEVITVIANCGSQTELATAAIFRWIQSKQTKGRTQFEILGKLELMENKFRPFISLHDSFHTARRASGLPPSRVLSAGVWEISQTSLNTLPEKFTSATQMTPMRAESSAGTASPMNDPQPSASLEPEPAYDSRVPTGVESFNTEVLDFETKRPPPLRLRTLLDARLAKMARRHSISVTGPPVSPDEDQAITPTPTRKNPLGISHLRRRSSIATYSSLNQIPTSPFQSAWTAPAVAFDPPAPPPLSYADSSAGSSPDFAESGDDPSGRPSTSSDSYYTSHSRTPSVTSFQIMDSVRRSVQAKFDPEMAETLVYGATAQHFLRIFRA